MIYACSAAQGPDIFGVVSVLAAMAAEAAQTAAEDMLGRKCLVGNYSLQGLALSWDQRAQVRNRIRSRGRLLLQHDVKLDALMVVPNVEKNIFNLRANGFVLSPLLHLMRQNGFLLPNIDRLISEIGAVYDLYDDVKVNAEIMYHEAWAMRYLISLLKGELCRELKEGKKKPCKEPRPN